MTTLLILLLKEASEHSMLRIETGSSWSVPIIKVTKLSKYLLKSIGGKMVTHLSAFKLSSFLISIVFTVFRIFLSYVKNILFLNLWNKVLKRVKEETKNEVCYWLFNEFHYRTSLIKSTLSTTATVIFWQCTKSGRLTSGGRQLKIRTRNALKAKLIWKAKTRLKFLITKIMTQKSTEVVLKMGRSRVWNHLWRAARHRILGWRKAFRFHERIRYILTWRTPLPSAQCKIFQRYDKFVSAHFINVFYKPILWSRNLKFRLVEQSRID